jgi:hypothetical protein
MNSLSCCFALFLSFACQSLLAQQQQVAPADDHEGVYRIHPDLEKVELILVPPAEIKPGFVYNYYHPGLKQRVWGQAAKNGGFEYAFGEGTTIPTQFFDLRLTPEMQARVLNELAPGLLRELDIVGRRPAVRLNSKDIWELLPFPSSARVFDIATGARWEWHGRRRLAVLHTGGNFWHVVDGEYHPMTIVTTTACR